MPLMHLTAGFGKIRVSLFDDCIRLNQIDELQMSDLVQALPLMPRMRAAVDTQPVVAF